MRVRSLRFSVGLAALPLLAGCTGLVPYEQLRRSLPEAEFLAIRGQQVHVESAGKGEPVLLVHGFGGSTYSWREVIPRLARNYRVVALDLNGFGYTERPRRLRAYTRQAQLDLCLGVLDALGIDSAHVIGHSYGGGLAMTLAARHPERVRSLVLVNSTAPNWALSRRRNLAELSPLTWLFVHGWALRPATVRQALERAWYDDRQVTEQVVAEYLKRLEVEGAARAYRGLTAPIVSPEEDPLVNLQDLAQPTLVLWGAEDELIAGINGKMAAAEMARGRFVELESCGHAPMEERPESFVAAVEDFLGSLERPQAAISTFR